MVIYISIMSYLMISIISKCTEKSLNNIQEKPDICFFHKYIFNMDISLNVSY